MGGRNQETRHDLRFHSPLKMPSSAFVYIVDDDKDVLESLGDLLRSVDYQVALYGSASDFLTKPIRDQDLLDAVAAAIGMDQVRRQNAAQVALLREKYARLTARERQVMALVASGLMNKQVASELSISEVTVKMHRGSVMRKLGAKTVAMLARMAEALEIER